jgi:AcrR family transcriptional regulator
MVAQDSLTAATATSVTTPTGAGAKERILNAAYDLFSRYGTRAVGIDTIIATSGVAKMSLYKHFKSKEELVLAFLMMRQARWTHDWLEAGIQAAGGTPAERLLAAFDVFHEWFQRSDFEGCSFINVLLESTPESAIHQSASAQLAEIRKIIVGLAEDAGLADAERFAQTWHFLMKGCIVSANEGNLKAAELAKEAGRILITHWPRA